MTAAEQAEYLKAKGWAQKGELWQRAKNGYLWEISAAVRQQKFADEEAKCTTTNGPTRNGPKK